MSDHQLKFKGPGFDFDARGWQAIAAAIAIVGIGRLALSLSVEDIQRPREPSHGIMDGQKRPDQDHGVIELGHQNSRWKTIHLYTRDI